MKILISGATGFIGKNLSNKLLNDGCFIHAIIRPSTKIELLDKRIVPYIFNGSTSDLISFMKTEGFDGVIHLASMFIFEHKLEDVDNLINSNVLFSTKLLEASVRAEIPWFINTGTFWQHYNDMQYSPVNLYAATKQAFEDISKYYLETSKINFVNIKLCDTFGPGDTRSKVFNLWAKISESGETLDMSAGQQIIDINYIDNIVAGYVRLVELLNSGDATKLLGKTFAIRADERMSLKDLALVFEKTTGKKLHINWGKREYRNREVMIPWTKGKRIPGWKHDVSIEEGILKTLKK